MRKRLPIRHQAARVLIGLVIGGVYLAFCIYTVGGAWQRKEGDLPPASPSLQHVSLFVVTFPFGFLPGFSSLLVALILNGLLWGALAGWLYARYVARKLA